VLQAKSKTKEVKYGTAERSLIFPPLPLARELKVVLAAMRLALVLLPASQPVQKDREFAQTRACQD
jgi:hypothetical protein